MLVLRDYQENAVNNIRTAFLQGRGAPLLVVPTGGGKTVIFSHISGQTVLNGKRVFVLVHRIELLRQTSKALKLAKVRHGIINPKFTPDYAAGAQVASVQTLLNRVALFDKYPPDLIIIDEAHHATAGTWAKIVNAARLVNPKCRIIGVTATPERADGNGLGVEAGGLFDDLIIGPTVAELIAAGFLVKPVIYAPPTLLDLSKVKTVAGDYDRHQLGEEMQKPGITGDAVKHYAAVCPGSPAVAFCVSVEHARNVAAEFRAAGFSFAAVDGSMEDSERAAILNGLGGAPSEAEKAILKRLGFEKIDGVTSCDLISEGTDIPAIGCAILLRPTKSLGLFIQQVGRALRPCAGKDYAIILDHVGNVGSWKGGEFIPKHGLPEQDRQWSLGGRKKRKGKSGESVEPPVAVAMCNVCFAVHEPAPACPQCGNVYKIKAKSKLKHHEGELKQITPEAALKIVKTKVARMEVGRAKTLEDLQKIGIARGYGERWALHVFAAKNKKALEI